MGAYTSVEQRILASCLETFPPFHPAAGAQASEDSQRAFYDAVRALYARLRDQPELLFATLHPDDAYRNRFNKASDGKPELRGYMKRAMDGVSALLQTLRDMMRLGALEGDALRVPPEVPLKRAHLAVLAAIGLPGQKEGGAVRVDIALWAQALPAWRWMAARADVGAIEFSRCMFDPAHSYASDIYANLLGDESAFRALEAFLVENGYERIDNRENQIALDYVKEYADTPTPVKDSWAERTHGGFSAKYDPMVGEPAFFSLRVPMLRELLARAGDMDETVRAFMIAHTKKCDGCRYCVQTDKTGKRPLACFPVEHAGKTVRLCPLFAGFNFCWTRMSAPLAQDMIAALRFIDRALAK